MRPRYRPVPRYYLHLINGVGETRDEEGQEAVDLDGARIRAVQGIRSILSDDVAHGRLDLRGRIEIADADGTCLGVVPFSDALDLQLED